MTRLLSGTLVKSNIVATAITLMFAFTASAQTPAPASTQVTAPKPKDTTTAQTRLHTYDEFMVIIKNSQLSYDYGEVDDSVAAKRPDTTRPVLGNRLRIRKIKGVPELVPYTESPQIKEQLELLNQSNFAKNYRMSLGFSEKMLQLDTNYNPARTMIGDAYYLLEMYDSSIYWLRSSIKHNYPAYEAHWFLADALLRKGDSAEAMKELTIAHVLNVNSGLLRESLKDYRKGFKRPMEEWGVRPYFTLSKKADTVYVRYSKGWEGYAIAKAVWRYEPGYAESQLGHKPDGATFRMFEEREALFAAQSKNEDLQKRMSVISRAGYIDEFLLYEMAAPHFPNWIVTMPKSIILRLAEYVDKFH
jgi:tetratricopeptide (TPR) repeat protein